MRSAARDRTVPKKTRRTKERKPKAERWRELLDAAAEIFHEKGFDGTSLQDIADRVGILKGSIYYYIESKTDLRNSLLKEVHKEGLLAISDAFETEGDALQKLETMIRQHIDYICKNLSKTTVYLQELKKLGAVERAELLGRQNYRNAFEDVLALGKREGVILRELDTQLAAQAMLASLNSIYQWYRPTQARPHSDIADHFVAVILRGHAAPSTPR